MSSRMWRPKLVSSFTTSTFWVTHQATKAETSSIAGCRLNWCSRAACLLFVLSGGLAIMLQRSKFKILKTLLTIGLCLLLASPMGSVLAQKPDDVVIKVDTRLVVLHATVVDKNSRLGTTL